MRCCEACNCSSASKCCGCLHSIQVIEKHVDVLLWSCLHACNAIDGQVSTCRATRPMYTAYCTNADWPQCLFRRLSARACIVRPLLLKNVCATLLPGACVLVQVGPLYASMLQSCPASRSWRPLELKTRARWPYAALACVPVRCRCGSWPLCACSRPRTRGGRRGGRCGRGLAGGRPGRQRCPVPLARAVGGIARGIATLPRLFAYNRWATRPNEARRCRHALRIRRKHVCTQAALEGRDAPRVAALPWPRQRWRAAPVRHLGASGSEPAITGATAAAPSWVRAAMARMVEPAGGRRHAWRAPALGRPAWAGRPVITDEAGPAVGRQHRPLGRPSAADDGPQWAWPPTGGDSTRLDRAAAPASAGALARRRRGTDRRTSPRLGILPEGPLSHGARDVPMRLSARCPAAACHSTCS